MNLILVDQHEIDSGRVRLDGRRAAHVRQVHRKRVGEEVRVGVVGGRIGRGVIRRMDEVIELEVVLEREPPAKLPVTLVVALPRPKVLNRVIASATALGVERIELINAWKVEKSYWSDRRLAAENLLEQRRLGLEQAVDTVLPEIVVHRFFREWVEGQQATGHRPQATGNGQIVVAHPGAREAAGPVRGKVTLVVGPEGGFVEQEIESLEKAGARLVSLGARVLRTETAVAALVGCTMLAPWR